MIKPSLLLPTCPGTFISWKLFIRDQAAWRSLHAALQHRPARSGQRAPVPGAGEGVCPGMPGQAVVEMGAVSGGTRRGPGGELGRGITPSPWKLHLSISAFPGCCFLPAHRCKAKGRGSQLPTGTETSSRAAVSSLEGFSLVLTSSVAPCLSFPTSFRGAMVWPGSQPGCRGLNSCFVPAALVGRCSGKVNIPLPGIYGLAAPSLRLPARGTGRGAALLSVGRAEGPLCPVPTILGVSAGPPAVGSWGTLAEVAAGGCFSCPNSPGVAQHPYPRLRPGLSGQDRPPRLWGPPKPGPSRVPAPLAVASVCFAGSRHSWAGVRGRGAARRAFLTYLTALPSQWDAAPVTPWLYDPAARPRPGCTS